MSNTSEWPSIADLLGKNEEARVALLGVPLGSGSVTPGRCDLGPGAFRQALSRLSTYNIEIGQSLDGLDVFDGGDLDLKLLTPDTALGPVRNAVSEAIQGRDLAILIGGNNAITRPAVRGMNPDLSGAGLITLDAHFDLRSTDRGAINGNPVQCLLDDGLPGRNIVQIGLQPFANTRQMHERAISEGISVTTAGEVRHRGIADVLSCALEDLAEKVDCVFVDFDIDVICRTEFKAAPGARPGGLDIHDFFEAARIVGANSSVRAVDLSEFDPSLSVGDNDALIAARWMAELLSGYQTRV